MAFFGGGDWATRFVTRDGGGGSGKRLAGSKRRRGRGGNRERESRRSNRRYNGSPRTKRFQPRQAWGDSRCSSSGRHGIQPRFARERSVRNRMGRDRGNC